MQPFTDDMFSHLVEIKNTDLSSYEYPALLTTTR
jgi:hypothetical protein